MLACANSVLTSAVAIFFVLIASKIFYYGLLNFDMKSFRLKYDFVLVALSQHLRNICHQTCLILKE